MLFTGGKSVDIHMRRPGGLGWVFIKVFVNCLGYKLLSFITSQLSFVSNVCVFPDVYYYQVEIKIQTFHSEPIFPTIN